MDLFPWNLVERKSSLILNSVWTGIFNTFQVVSKERPEFALFRFKTVTGRKTSNQGSVLYRLYLSTGLFHIIILQI